MADSDLKSVIVAPVVVGNRTLGAIVVLDGTRFYGERERRLVESSARECVRQIEVALKNVGAWASFASQTEPTGTLIGESNALGTYREQLLNAADSDFAVLITGESGTGKGETARLLHASSARSKGPLLVLNMGAIPPGLIESTLFGHAKGAFTGASEDKMGFFEAAAGGTLFLDEIGELPLELQPRLLQVLDLKRVTRMGETFDRAIDVRIVAATNRDLAQAVREGKFRSDLLYRLKILTLKTIPLRENKEDLDRLIDHLLRRIAVEARRPLKSLEGAARTRLRKYDWPGNVRELYHVLARAVVMNGRPIITVTDLQFEEKVVPRQTPVELGGEAGEGNRPYFELLRTLIDVGGSPKKAWEALKISKAKFYRLRDSGENVDPGLKLYHFIRRQNSADEE